MILLGRAGGLRQQGTQIRYELSASSRFWFALDAYFANVRGERGGVLLGDRSSGQVQLGMAVFPPRSSASPTHCDFEVSSVALLSDAIELQSDPTLRRNCHRVVGWVHSHPGLGVFLSNTDIRTFRSWTGLDEQAIALVVDPFDRVRTKAAWDSRGSEMRLEYGPDTSVGLSELIRFSTTLAGESPRGWWDLVCEAGVVSVER